MTGVKPLFPQIYLGYRGVMEFKKSYKGDIKSVSSADDVRDLVAYYQGFKKLSHPLVIEDLSRLSSQALSSLLKFIEESKLDLIFLSLFDQCPGPILSRMKVVNKKVDRVKCEFMNLSDGLSLYEELDTDLHPLMKIKKVLEASPQLALLLSQNRVKSSSKVLKILVKG